MNKGLPVLSLALVCLLLFSGCQALSYKTAKVPLPPPRPTLLINGTTLQLVSLLHRTMYPDGKRFDLNGQLTLKAVDGSFPTNLTVQHLRLKPGGANCDAVNFREKNGNWLTLDNDPDFTGSTRFESNRVIIEFLWKDLDGSVSTKPQDFVVYDVTVTLSDGKKEIGALSTLDIPTD